MSRTVRIAALGARGDGIAHTDGGPLYVPYTLPGELVEIGDSGGDRRAPERIVEASPDRVQPVCRHFGACGGCALQHMGAAAYCDWKRQLLVDAFARAGIGGEIGQLVAGRPQTRRRAVLAGINTVRGPVLGFHAAASHDVVAIEECPVLVPEIGAAFDRLRRLVTVFDGVHKPLRLTVTATGAGLDIDIGGVGSIDNAVRQALVGEALAAPFARISVDGEIIVEPQKPAVGFGTASVTPPPAGFLQATADGEQAMADLVCAHLARAKRIVDLFAGSGTFSLRLARNAMVHAVEQDGDALTALDTGFRFGDGLKTVSHERRDLFRRPLTLSELKRFDGLVFDPPRAGAKDQAAIIARSSIARVAAVSCNPTTLARDVAMLIDGGYRLVSATPIDQFLWSPHVEAVALLEKPSPPRRRR